MATNVHAMTVDPEIAAMAAIARALDPLTEEARTRVLAWARSRYAPAVSVFGTGAAVLEPVALSAKGTTAGPVVRTLASFRTLAEFLVECSADSDAQRVLAAATFMAAQVNAGQFTSAQVHAELKHVGHRVANITRTLEELIAAKPALVAMEGKSGATKQARKLYSVTDAGRQEVQRMLRGAR
jgi:hypothetical protein